MELVLIRRSSPLAQARSVQRSTGQFISIHDVSDQLAGLPSSLSNIQGSHRQQQVAGSLPRRWMSWQAAEGQSQPRLSCSAEPKPASSAPIAAPAELRVIPLVSLRWRAASRSGFTRPAMSGRITTGYGGTLHAARRSSGRVAGADRPVVRSGRKPPWWNCVRVTQPCDQAPPIRPLGWSNIEIRFPRWPCSNCRLLLGDEDRAAASSQPGLALTNEDPEGDLRSKPPRTIRRARYKTPHCWTGSPQQVRRCRYRRALPSFT